MFAAGFGYDVRPMRAFLVLPSLVVSLGLGGCGGCNDSNNVGHLPDARPSPDAPLDAPPIDAPPAAVTVTVTQGGDPLMGLTVYFQESDSTLVRAAQTGADGKASAVVHAGAFVTVVQVFPAQVARGGTPDEIPPGDSTQLATFAGVKEGDDLHLDLAPVTPAGTQITFDLSVPNEELGRTYTLYSSCSDPQPLGIGQSPVRAGRRAGGAGSAVAIPVTATVTLTGCGGTADMLVVSSDSETQALSWLYKPAVAVADGVPVDLTDDAYQDATDVTFTYTSVAPIIADLGVQRELRSAHGSLSFVTNQQFATPDSGTAIASLTETLPETAGLLAVTTTTDDPSAGSGRQTFFEWGAVGDYTLDYGMVALHGYASTPSFDVGNHAIAWSEASGGVAPDFVLGNYQTSRVDNNLLNTWTWQIVAPYAAGQAKLAYPVLPTTIYDYNPAAGEQPLVQRLTTIKAPGGYDALRAHAFNADLLSAVTGATGRIVSEDMFQLELHPSAATPRRSLSGRFTPRRR
jgi:hypothetical protein